MKRVYQRTRLYYLYSMVATPYFCSAYDYNKFVSSFLIMLKSKRARYYAKKDYAKKLCKNGLKELFWCNRSQFNQASMTLSDVINEFLCDLIIAQRGTLLRITLAVSCMILSITMHGHKI